MKAIVDFFLARSLLINVLTLAILLVGVLFAFNLQKEIFPRVDFGVITISTLYPGSSAEDVEKFVSIPIERQLRTISGVEKINVISFKGRSIAIMEVDPNSDLQKVVNDSKQAIDAIYDFPREVEPPMINSVNNKDQQLFSVVLSDMEYPQLRQLALDLQNRLETLSAVRFINLVGYRPDEIIIKIDPDKMKLQRITASQIANAIRQRNFIIPAGVVEDAGGDLFVRSDAEFKNLQQVANTVVRSNFSGKRVTISSVAQVIRRPTKSSWKGRANGKEAIMLRVVIKEKADILHSADIIKKNIEEFFQHKKLDHKRYHLIHDASYFVKRRLGVLTQSGLMGFALVFLCLLMSLNWRMAIVTSMGAPIAFAFSFIIMDLLGLTINLISMFSLIMVLGMLMDDAIIVAEYYFQKLESGLHPRIAARQAACDTIAPVSTTITTSIAAFSSFFFIEGTMGKFVWPIPAVAIICLLTSLLECYVIMPCHLADWVRLKHPGDANRTTGNTNTWYQRMLNFYQRILKRILPHHGKVVAGFVALFVISILVAKSIPLKLFPGDDVRLISMRVKGPPGTPLSQSEIIIIKMEQVAMDQLQPEEYDHIGANVGAQWFHRRMRQGSHYGELFVYLTAPGDRRRSTDEIISALKPQMQAVVEDYQLSVKRFKGGPPTGKDIEVEISGDELHELLEVANKIKTRLADIKGVVASEMDFEIGSKQIAVSIDEQQTRRRGLNPQAVALELRQVLSQYKIAYIRENDQDIEIKIALNDKHIVDIESIKKIHISGPADAYIPLASLITMRPEPLSFAIRRKNGNRVIAISATINDNIATPMAVKKELNPQLQQILAEYPDMTATFTGETADTRKSFSGLLKAFMISMVLIFLILIVMFGSLLQTIMIMLVIPLGFIGVVLSFKLFDRTIGFMALSGTVALIGVVVNDSIILVSFINRLLRQRPAGEDTSFSQIRQTVIDACLRRLRPILLTTITTISGLLFLAHPALARLISGGLLGRDSDPFLRPMALSFSWGLAFASLITLIFIPSMYLTVEKVRIICKRVWASRF